VQSDPPLTYRGALQILGHENPQWIERLATAVGVAIMTAPALGLVGPVSGIAAIWGWVDQKNEAIDLLRKGVARFRARRSGTNGYERQQLVAAAHTAIVVGSYFEVLRESYPDLRMNEDDKERLATESWRSSGQPLLETLYQTDIPAPSAAYGFEENLPAVRTWMVGLSHRVARFLEIASSTETANFEPESTAERAATRYRSHYVTLATDVPEFFCWASFGEHAATRTAIGRLRGDVVAALDVQTSALARLERVLDLTTAAPSQQTALRDSVWRANRGFLTEPIVPAESQHRDDRVVFPQVQEIYIEPGYRVATQGADARPWDDDWWKDQPYHENLDLFLAAYATAPQSSTVPMLLLGNPGAGKSMLTKVIAARLPRSRYTVVRVPLRRVDADGQVHQQIQQELDRWTNMRVSWAELADESRETIRVVLLDGLDELLQASKIRRSNYLHEVADFQRKELRQNQPVLVIVTSRTAVADQVKVPAGAPIAFLEGFDEPRIRTWLQRWETANAKGIASGTVRTLTPANALLHLHLAGQPVLLLLLAVYSADPQAKALEEGLSTAALYRELFQRFAYREITKQLGDDDPAVPAAVKEHLRRLRVAALAMFNRSAQSVSDEDLGNDLKTLSRGYLSDRAADLGQRTIGQFFFVHADQSDTHDERRAQASYEFLHATFGEFFVAEYILDEIVSLAGPGLHPDINDDLLHALISQQVLTKRPTVLTFFTELSELLSQDRRQQVAALLDQLRAGARQRPPSVRFNEYTPIGVDRLRELATYTANLTLLHLAVESPITEPDSSLTYLWQAGLDGESWNSLLYSVFRHNETLTTDIPDRRSWASGFMSAMLRGDDFEAELLQYGHAAWDGYFDTYSSPADLLIYGLVGTAVGHDAFAITAETLDADVSQLHDDDIRRINFLLNEVLASNCKVIPKEDLDKIVGWFLRNRDAIELRPYTLAVLAATRPDLLIAFPELLDPALYSMDGISSEVILSGRRNTNGDEEVAQLRTLHEEVRSLSLQNGVALPHDTNAAVRMLLDSQQRSTVYRYLTYIDEPAHQND
jgi:NACHT conflict system protein/NACHT domain-containing protein